MLISTRFKILLFICFFAISKGVANNPIRILTIGDSTMANYDEEKNSGEKEMRGWAQMLPTFVKDNVRVDNAARNGRSSKSFYIEFWEGLRETLKPGDYVFIQFGHNDEKNNGLDDEIGNPKRRGTAAWGQYQDFLTIYVNESRERGGVPILMTPVVRRLFENDTIIGIGRHSLTELAPDDSTMNYPKAMRALAEKLDVPLVDMTELTRELVEGMGAEKAKEIIYANNDNTHLKAMGGVLFAELAAKDLLRQGILTDYLVIPDTLIIKSTTSKNSGKQVTTLPEGGEKVTGYWNPDKWIGHMVSGKFTITEKTEGLKSLDGRGRFLLATPDNKWPAGDIDMDASRYIEFSISPSDKDMYVESVILNIGATEGSKMRFTALASTDASFVKTETLANMESLEDDKIKSYIFDKIIKIPAGEAFYIRIYPWHEGMATDKYLWIRDIQIDGLLFNK